jgi:hypothetical protein
VHHRGEEFSPPKADGLGGGIRALKLWILALNGLKLAHELVILSIRDKE